LQNRKWCKTRLKEIARANKRSKDKGGKKRKGGSNGGFPVGIEAGWGRSPSGRSQEEEATKGGKKRKAKPQERGHSPALKEVPRGGAHDPSAMGMVKTGWTTMDRP